ncbi:MAG: hypothetical protein ACJ76Y_24060 [Thermoanaerobaculia bacterium]
MQVATGTVINGKIVAIELADLNLLDLARSRRVEQEVLDLLDEPVTR